MSQLILLNNLAKFLAYDTELYISSLKTDLAKANQQQAEKINKQIKELKVYKSKIIYCLENSKGFCFALSICHGMMHLTGKLNWWEQGLVDLANWDDPKLLDAEIKLPGTTESKFPQTLTRRRFYERVLNYIISIQRIDGNENDTRKQRYIETFSEFFPDKMTVLSQRELLEPSKHIINIPNSSPSQIKRSYIELSLNEQIADIKAIDEIAGFLDDDTLTYLLDEKMFEERLCTIGSRYFAHGIQLSYNKTTSQWMLYDPNDNHKNVDSVHFTGTKEQVIQRIKHKFNHEISLTLYSINEEKNLQFPSLSEFKSPSTFAKELGLIIMMINTPKRARDYLKMAETDNKICDAVFEAFNSQDKKFSESQEKSGIQILVDTLGDNALLPFIKIAATDPKKASQLYKAMSQQNKDLENGFFTIVEKAPLCLKELIFLAKTDATFLRALSECLCPKSSYALAKRHSDQFKEFMKLVESDRLSFLSFLKALDLDILDFMRANNYNPFSSLFQMMESKECDPKTHQALSRLIHQHKNLIITYYPQHSSYIMKLKNPDLDELSKLVHLASESKENLEKLAKELQPGDLKQNGLLVIIKNDADLFNQLISLVEKWKDTDTMAVIIEKLHQSIDTIAMHQPVQLFRLFKFTDKNLSKFLSLFRAILDISNDKNGLINILKSLASSNSENETGWNVFLNHGGDSKRTQLIEHLKSRIQKLNSSDLIEIGNLVRMAFYKNEAELRGICKERHTLFRGDNTYGKTKLWTSLLSEIQIVLKKQDQSELNVDVAHELKVILNEKAKR